MKKIGLAFIFLLSWSMLLCGDTACYRNLANHFFDDERAIMQALSLHRVTESSWVPIVRDLQRLSRGAFAAARQRARSLVPNPLEPFLAAPAEKLLILTLQEIFQNVLNRYLITNQDGIHDMFDYIRRQQPLWQECFSPSPN